MEYNVSYDFAALGILMTLAFHYLYSRNIKNRRAVVYEYLMIFVFLATIFDLITISVDRVHGTVPLVLDYILNDICLLSVTAVAMVYYIYIYVCSHEGVIEKKQYLLFGGFYAICAFLILTTPLTDWIFYFNEQGVYTHGKYYPVLFVASFAYLALAMIRSIKYHNALTRWQHICLNCFTIMMFGAIIFQAYYPKHMIMQYAAAISCLLLCFSLENPSDYKDRKLDVYNRAAFYDVFNFFASREKKFQVLAIQIDGLHAINDMFGLTMGNEVMKEMAEFLSSCVKTKNVFHLNGATFCILGSFTKEYWETIQNRVKERFRYPFDVHNTQISLSAPMCMLYYPERVHRLDDAIDMIHHALEQARLNRENEVIIADDVILEKSKRERMIEQVLKDALLNDRFEVYYQPIYSTSDGKYTRAEALVRLNDEKLGRIGPDEFIPVAEQRGMITEIGAVVFQKVCQFIQKERIWEKGMERIDVNLSAVQCMQEKLAERLIDIMDAYQIPYKTINFEITETAAIVSKDNLRKNMEKLIEKGINFSMDDFGSGYSNTLTIIEYPFTVVKLDKSMLWNAMKKPRAMQALKHTIAMLNDMGFEIITEGVETTEMGAKLQMLGCQLHQGYYYSKPLPEKEFLEICLRQ